MKKRHMFMFVAAALMTSASAFADETDPQVSENEEPATTPTTVQETPAPAVAPTPYVMDEEQRKYLAPQPAPQPAVVVVAPAPRPYQPRHNQHPLRVGFGLSLGVPQGLALGVVVHPMIDWVSLQAAFTENVLSPGGLFSAKVDPMALMPRLPVGVYADFQGGFTGRGTIPGHSDLPSLGYDYFNAYAGLRLGRMNGFHWLFAAGPTYLHATAGNFQAVVNSNGGGNSGLTIGNPVVKGWVVPTAMTGLEVVWP